jgi:hypothetical protein
LVKRRKAESQYMVFHNISTLCPIDIAESSAGLWLQCRALERFDTPPRLKYERSAQFFGVKRIRFFDTYCN